MLDLRLSDWQDGKLRVKATKGGKDTYYTGEDLADAVETCIALRGGHQLRSVYLFSTRYGQRYTGDGFRSIWSRAMRKYVNTGGERFTEHDLRAKVASDDPANAQARLQHRSNAMVKTVYDRRPAQVHVLTNREKREKTDGKSK
jgi:integrase